MKANVTKINALQLGIKTVLDKFVEKKINLKTVFFNYWLL